MTVPLTKVDSAIAGLSIHDEKPPAPSEKEVKSSKKEKEKGHRRASSTAEGVYNIKDLGTSSHDILIASFPILIIVSLFRGKEDRNHSPH
jgi:hypothetical protein